MRQIEGNAKEELASATTGRILGKHFVADGSPTVGLLPFG